MYPTGHFGVALLASWPAPLVLGRRTGTVLSTIALLAAILPDLDKHVPVLTHHGVTHTFLFAGVLAVAVGLLAAGATVAVARLRGSFGVGGLTARRAFGVTAAGVFVGASAHVVADVLVVLPGTQPVSPFWPVFEEKLRFEVIPLGAPVRNLALLLAGLGAHALVYRFAVDESD